MAERHPILMLHGIWKTGAVFRPMRKHLEERGFQTHTLDLVPNDGSAGLDALSADVARNAEALFPRDQPFDLIAFSMGGVVARHYLQRRGGLARVRRFVSIGSPQNGTLTAHFRGLTGVSQMRPKSSFLADLASDIARLGEIDVTSIWTPLDLMVVPATSSRLPVGHEVLVAAPLHALLLRDGRCFRAVTEALEAPLGSRARRDSARA